jgi:hypothetical protein
MFGTLNSLGLQEGDSGSWVVNVENGHALGHVIGFSDRVCYLQPFTRIFREVDLLLNTINTELAPAFGICASLAQYFFRYPENTQNRELAIEFSMEAVDPEVLCSAQPSRDKDGFSWLDYALVLPSNSKRSLAKLLCITGPSLQSALDSPRQWVEQHAKEIETADLIFHDVTSREGISNVIFTLRGHRTWLTSRDRPQGHVSSLPESLIDEISHPRLGIGEASTSKTGIEKQTTLEGFPISPLEDPVSLPAWSSFSGSTLLSHFNQSPQLQPVKHQTTTEDARERYTKSELTKGTTNNRISHTPLAALNMEQKQEPPVSWFRILAVLLLIVVVGGFVVAAGAGAGAAAAAVAGRLDQSVSQEALISNGAIAGAIISSFTFLYFVWLAHWCMLKEQGVSQKILYSALLVICAGSTFASVEVATVVLSSRTIAESKSSHYLDYSLVS